MKFTKPPLSVEQQIALLQSRGVTVNDPPALVPRDPTRALMGFAGRHWKDIDRSRLEMVDVESDH